MPSIDVCVPRLVGRAIQHARERPIEDVVDERGLARSADAGHGREHAERQRDVDVLQVVLARALDHDLAARGGTPRSRRPDAAFTAQVRAGQRSATVPQQVGGRALEDHVAAVLAGAGPQIDHVVGRANRLFVVLDDDDGVAEIAQAGERREQARGCRAGAGPIDGSSRTYSTPVRFDPICVARRMRWPSPPESVAALRPSVR